MSDQHKGPHCAGLCEGAAYIAMLRQKDKRIESLEATIDQQRRLLWDAKCPERFSKLTNVHHLTGQGGMWPVPGCDFCNTRNQLLDQYGTQENSDD